MRRFLTATVTVIALAMAGLSPSHAAEWAPPNWLTESPHSPKFVVKDTENKYGRYSTTTKTVLLSDLIKFHGHFCGGLVEAAGSLRVAFDNLFGNGPIDRTDLRIASNNSACGGDVAAYLTGARTRFGSHFIDKSLTASEFVVQQVSTGKTVRVRVRPESYPTEVRKQMRKLESGKFNPTDIELFQKLQWDYAKRTVTQPLAATFMLLDSAGYKWPPSPCRNLGRRKDNDFKRAPSK